MGRLLGLMACLAACTSAPVPAVSTSVSLPAAVTSGEGSCPPDWCAGNSPEIAARDLWDVNLDHHPNAQGFVLLGMSKDGRFYDLDVRSSALVAIDPGGNITGSGLKGFTLWLQQGAAEYGLKIVEVGSVHEMVPPGAPVETYVLRWSAVSEGLLNRVVQGGEVVREPTLSIDDTPLCQPWGQVIERHVREPITSPEGGGRPRLRTVYSWPPADAAWDESTEIPPFNAVVFEGDRIDATTRTVRPDAEDRWFNIGCARHTLSKMRLTRNTLHTVVDGDWRQVQATLKMLSADYCGNGTALTVTGTPIVWQQVPPPSVGAPPSVMTYRFPPQPGSLEARWDEYGAICLDTPRLAVHPNPDFPDIAESITQACTPGGDVAVRLIAACNDPDPLHEGRERIPTRITTANYDPAP